MALRHVGLGPVFAFEWLGVSRRWQGYAARSLFVGFLLGGLLFVWWSRPANVNTASIRSMSQVGENFFYAIVGMQLSLVLMVAPAATAGSICADRASGKLTHLLVTDLSSAEIVLGKLAARLVPVLGLVACALPVLALGTLLGGIDPVALTGAFLVTVGLAVLGCSLALLLSVWATKPHEVILATYAIWVIWLLGYPMYSVFNAAYAGTWAGALVSWIPIQWVGNSNPFDLAFAPYTRPMTARLWHHGAFLVATLAISALLVGVAVARVRPSEARKAGRALEIRLFRKRRAPERPSRWNRWMPAPSMDLNPVLWREWHRRRPSGWTASIGFVYAGLAIVFTFIGVVQFWSTTGPPGPTAMVLIFTNGFLVAIGLLILSVLAATALAEERARGSLDVLLATPLNSSTIVLGKWLGTFRIALILTILPVLITTACTLRLIENHRWMIAPAAVLLILAYGAAATSLGLALATWVPRLGRAIGLSVGAIVFMNVGFFFGTIFLFNNLRMNHREWEGFLIGSPFAGAVLPQVALFEQHQSFGWTLAWTIFWMLVYGGIAIALLVATLLSFDRCLGRMGGPIDSVSSILNEPVLPLGPPTTAREFGRAVRARARSDAT